MRKTIRTAFQNILYKFCYFCLNSNFILSATIFILYNVIFLCFPLVKHVELWRFLLFCGFFLLTSYTRYYITAISVIVLQTTFFEIIYYTLSYYKIYHYIVHVQHLIIIHIIILFLFVNALLYSNTGLDPGQLLRSLMVFYFVFIALFRDVFS